MTKKSEPAPTKATKKVPKKAKKGTKGKKSPDALDLGEGLAFIDIAKPRSIHDITVAINAEMKKDIIMPASLSGNPYLLRRPFGLATIDRETGGGPPAGGVTQLEGPDKAGKNALLWQMIKTLQYIYGDATRVLWTWLEGPVDKQHGRIVGAVIAASDLEIALENQERAARGWAPLSNEMIMDLRQEIGEFAVVHHGTPEEKLDVTASMIAMNQFQLVGIDSIGAIAAKPLIDTALGKDPRRGAIAIVQTLFQHKMWNAFANPADGCGTTNFTTVVALNQVRANQNISANPAIAKRQKKQVATDAHAIKHGKLIDLQLGQGAPITKSRVKVGKEMTFEVIKGKAGCHEGPRGVVPYYFASGFDAVTDLVANLKRDKLLVDRNTKVDVIDAVGEVILEDAPHGEGLVDFKEAISDDRDLYWKLYRACMQKAGMAPGKTISCLYKLQGQ